MLKKSLYNIGKNFSMVIAAQIAYKIMLFITFILIARNLGVIGFGKFSYAMAFAGFFVPLADFGTSSSIIKDTSGIDRHKTGEYLSNVLSLKLILSVAAIFIAFMFSYLLKENTQMINIIMLSLIFLIINTYAATFRSIFRVYERMEYDAFSVFLEGALKLVFIIMLIHFFRDNLIFIVVILLAANVITLLAAAYIAHRRFIKIKFSFKISCWSKIMNSGMVFVFVGFFQMINLKIDIVMLSKMTTDTITGIYSVATRVVEPILVIPLTFAAVSFPVLSRLYKESKSTLRSLSKTSLRLICLVSIMVTVLIYLGSETIIPKILGISYIEAICAIQILCWLFIPIFIRLFLEGIALATDMRKRLYWGYLSSTLAKIAMNVVLIPVMGYKGAAIGTIAAEFVIIGFLWNRAVYKN